MKAIRSILAIAGGVAISLSASAQEQATTASSSGSKRPIPTSDQMFRKTIWRSVDLREKQNKPMFSEGKEISRVIIEAVKRGELTPYRNDSLTSTFTPTEMTGNMSYADEGMQLSQDQIDAGFGASDMGGGAASDDGWGSGGDGWGATPKKGDKKAATDKGKKTAAAPKVAAPTAYEYRAKDLFQINLKEDMIFDKKRSRMYHDIKTLELIVPASAPGNKAGYDKPVATFKYSDLVRVFRNNPQNAIWFNAQNDAQHKNLADAFELWLFNSYITKVSNPSDSDLGDIYGSQRQGILAAQQTAADLVEYEYNLWSF